MTEHHEGDQLPPTRRPGLVEELDEVIEEHLTRFDVELEKLADRAQSVLDDYRVLRSSFELRARFSGGEQHPKWKEFRDIDLPSGLLRWLHEQSVRTAGPLRPIRSFASRPSPAMRAGRSDQPSSRIEQVLSVLRSVGRPLTTDDIVEAMLDRGLLENVVDPRATISAALSRGTRQGFVERVSRGVYTTPAEEESSSEDEEVEGEQ